MDHEHQYVFEQNTANEEDCRPWKVSVFSNRALRNSILKLMGALGELIWSTGIIKELLYEMRNEDLIEWITADHEHRGGWHLFRYGLRE